MGFSIPDRSVASWRNQMRQLLVAGLTVIAIPALAETPVLTVLTYDSFTSEWGPGPVIEKAFETECGCDLKLVPAGDGAALLARIRLEGAASEADVVLGLDTSLTAAGLSSRGASDDWTITDVAATMQSWLRVYGASIARLARLCFDARLLRVYCASVAHVIRVYCVSVASLQASTVRLARVYCDTLASRSRVYCGILRVCVSM